MRKAMALVLGASAVFVALAACDDSSTETPNAGIDASVPAFEAGPQPAVPDAAPAPLDATPDAEPDAGKVLPDGLIDPVSYRSRADSPFVGVVLSTYDHFEDWEDGMVNTPGVTPSSTQLGSDFGAGLIDSVDGDDGTVDGVCQKIDGTCNDGFANGTISFTFDATALGGQLPTHVGIAWTDGSFNCDAIFEAYDATDTLIGTRTATGVGDGSNSGTVEEDRYFAVVHRAGVKRIVVTSSSGGVEVDHLHYGR